MLKFFYAASMSFLVATLSACGGSELASTTSPVEHDPNSPPEAVVVDNTPGTPAQVAACAEGANVTAGRGSIAEEEWIQGIVAGGPQGQSYWFRSYEDPNACACSGCAAGHCLTLTSVPARAACVN